MIPSHLLFRSLAWEDGPLLPPLNPFISQSHRREKGIALIVVVCLLSLMLLLLVAIFSLSDTELKATKHYVSGQQARQLADVAVNIAVAQVRRGTTGETDPASGRMLWISQPGLVRKYGADGSSAAIYKLYSSSRMILRGSSLESAMLTDVSPQDWESQPLRYTDLNRPIYRSDNAGSPHLLFPIIDPRAMTGTADGVRGFSYSNKFANGSTLDGVVTTGGEAQRLPMPVEWLYQLKDGTLGVLDTSNRFVGPAQPTRDNPIVGRIAFWTDDESSKVNINTASEPTFWALPTFFHKRDGDWAKYQPVNGEFQRYPGHPATTALSPILFPSRQIASTDKDLIYNLVPKIGPGGSKNGTVSYDDPTVAAIQFGKFRKEHLYASLDEFLLKDDRSQNDFGAVANAADSLQHTAFFLTAHSKAPETNPFGRPKVAMWPVSYRGKDFRSPYDNLIAFCATLGNASGPRLYEFQRGYAHSTGLDISNADNQALLGYLLDLLKRPVPGFAQDGATNFSTKYHDDLPQILVEFFDYIRSINLHDTALVDSKTQPPDASSNTLLGYTSKYKRPVDFKTFTDPRFVQTSTDPDTGQAASNEYLGLPGHGQVAPSSWTKDGKTYQGIGRFPTISEIGLHFICCADNTDDANNPFPAADPNIGKPGGGSAPKLNSTDNNVQDRWYSNFPPTPTPDPSKGQKANLAKYPFTEGYPYGKDPNHPGYSRPNWNWQLLPNTPLQPGKRRIQARLLFEFFVPAAGYTILEPEISIRVTGLSKFKVNGTPLFPNDSEVVRTGRKATNNGVTETGGHALGVKGILRERECPGRAPMPDDNSYGGSVNGNTADWEVTPSDGTYSAASLSTLNYDLVSNYVDIDVGKDGKTSMQISNADITVEIYCGHLGKKVTVPEQSAALVQTLQVGFPVDAVKAPTLVRNPIPAWNSNPATEAPWWWTFYGKGCMGFSVATLKQNTGSVLDGRFHGGNIAPKTGNTPTRGAFFYGFDSVVVGAPRTFRPVQSSGATQADVDAAEEAEGSDVVQTMIIKHGDYRLTAAMPVVDQSQWKPHRYWGQKRLAHNFANETSNQIPGYDYGGNVDNANRLVPNTNSNKYSNDRIPKFPYFTEASAAAHRYYDFDNAFGPERDGPYINKPDEGSLGALNTGTAYFTNVNKATQAGSVFFSPNRQVPSPVVFGSLPAGVQAGDAWRTLLFRPQQNHPGGTSARGGQDPPDHLLLEFFWMPVVEPYAISETLSTSGKINLNYQIFPFTNIRRASALHAVMANEMITAVDEKDMPDYKSWPQAGNTSTWWQDSDGKTWDYPIDVERTLAQFEERFAKGKAFLSPSEICDLYLVPQNAPGVRDYTQMETFWSTRRLTGDNTRERPYSTLYPRLTTRSNTFRVHYITQTINKARGTAPDTMDATADQIGGEYRGSAVIERYLDPTRKDFPDFTAGYTSDSLDNYYEFRVIETKKFGS